MRAHSADHSGDQGCSHRVYKVHFKWRHFTRRLTDVPAQTRYTRSHSITTTAMNTLLLNCCVLLCAGMAAAQGARTCTHAVHITARYSMPRFTTGPVEFVFGTATVSAEQLSVYATVSDDLRLLSGGDAAADAHAHTRCG